MVAERLNRIRVRVAAAAVRAGRDPQEVTLVAVSKGSSVGQIMEAYGEGQRDFGENRAAELAAKAPDLPDDIRWHFIGSLQTRQVKVARPHTTLLHSVDRARLVGAWSAPGATPPPVLIQANLAAEPQKHGVAPEGVAALLDYATEARLTCTGLMMIPPMAATPEDSRRWFVMLREMRDAFQAAYPGLVELSMGMTDDFEVAIEEGATIIRVGRAIFGEPGVPA